MLKGTSVDPILKHFLGKVSFPEKVVAILIICVSSLRNCRDESGEENIYCCLNVSLFDYMDPNKYFSVMSDLFFIQLL